jgi:hypothetical protein
MAERVIPVLALLVGALNAVSCREDQSASARIIQDTLPTANAILTEKFTALTSVRELSDGRVLLSDPREARLVVGDFNSQNLVQLSKTGRGPGEYVLAAPFHAIGGDSTISADGLSKRWLIFNRDRIVDTRTASDRAVMTVRFAYGFDDFGGVLTNALPALPKGSSSQLQPESTVVVLVSRADGQTQFVTRLQSPRAPGPQTPPAILKAYEQAVLASDGWIAVVRLDPYRLDWRTRDGQWIYGKPIPVRAQPIDEAERNEYRRSVPTAQGATAFKWPDVLPPFTPGWPPIIAGNEYVLVRRARSAHFDGVRYDVIDRRGELERQLILRKNERILGFGTKSVYIVAADESDLETLRRHDWRASQF